MDRSTKMKINKETQALNDTLNKMELIDIYRTFHPKTTEYTFFSSAHGTFCRTDHILGHKSSLGKVKKIHIISRIFSNHNAMRLDINYRQKTVKKGLPWWRSGWEYACQWRRHGFRHWSGKTPHAVAQLSPCTTTTEACTTRTRAPQQEKPPQWEAHAQQQRVAPAHHN